jgi:hypothetical protein
MAASRKPPRTPVPRPRSPLQLVASAFHESGHAVAAVRLDSWKGIGVVTIDPRIAEGQHGMVLRRSRIPDVFDAEKLTASIRRNVRLEMTIGLAGPFAETHLRAAVGAMRGRRARVATAESSDSLHVIGLADLLHPSDDLKRHNEIARATQRANTLVLKNWEPIQQVAVLLLIRGTLTGSEVLQGTIPRSWMMFSPDEFKAAISRPVLHMLDAAARWSARKRP